MYVHWRLVIKCSVFYSIRSIILCQHNSRNFAHIFLTELPGISHCSTGHVSVNWFSLECHNLTDTCSITFLIRFFETIWRVIRIFLWCVDEVFTRDCTFNCMSGSVSVCVCVCACACVCVCVCYGTCVFWLVFLLSSFYTFSVQMRNL